MDFADMLKEITDKFDTAINGDGGKGKGSDTTTAVTSEDVTKLLKGLEQIGTRMTAVEKLLVPADEEKDTKPGEVIVKMATIQVDGETNREALDGTIDRVVRLEKAFGIRQSRGDEDETEDDDEKGKTQLAKSKDGGKSGIFDTTVHQLRKGKQVKLVG